MKRMRRIAAMTSGGDAPGMNAAIRAVVRAASTYDLETYGVVGGFTGLLGGSFRPLDDRAVGGVLLRGGTFLGSSCCPGFKDRATQGTALARLAEAEIDGIVVIGGNGSQRGTLALHQLGFPAVGVASTIDNDLAVTETTIGVDTALNTAAEYEARMTILRHVQRGGSPTVRDRILGSQLGAAAVQALREGRSGVMTGWVRGEVVEIPLAAALDPVTKVPPELLALARTLAR